MADTIASLSLERLFSAMPTGSLDRAILNNLRGINHRQVKNMLPMNKEMPGYTFFVRPQLNMQKDNIRNARKMTPLLSSVSTSIQNYIRCLLDPRLMEGVRYSKNMVIPPIDCPILDNKMAFIPMLTNNLESISGWPSISVPTFTSDPGLYNESWAAVDGRVVNNEVFDITANFRNTRGDPILFFFYIWVLYMSYVFDGRLVPYLDFITENELDYCTRIYRIVLDPSKERVTKIAATNAAFPVGLPIGDAFDIPGDKAYSEANREISMRFKCMGVDYFDDILVKEFNETVAIFNPEMLDDQRDQYMALIPPSLVDKFNWTGYPRINPNTSAMEWYVPFDYYEKRLSEITSGYFQTA